MIVHRMTFYIKPGHLEEACTLVLAEIKLVVTSYFTESEGNS